MIKLLIFDFDDTLLHLNVDWFSFEKELYSSFNVNSELESKLSSFTLPQKLNYLSNDSISLKKSLSIQQKYESMCVKSKNYVLFAPMLDFLILAKSKGFSIAIVSANLISTIESILTDLNLISYVDLVVGRDSCKKTKPDKEPIIFALKKLNFTDSQSLFIGDSINDSLASNSANVSFYCIDPQNPKKAKQELSKLLSIGQM